MADVGLVERRPLRVEQPDVIEGGGSAVTVYLGFLRYPLDVLEGHRGREVDLAGLEPLLLGQGLGRDLDGDVVVLVGAPAAPVVAVGREDDLLPG